MPRGRREWGRLPNGSFGQPSFRNQTDRYRPTLSRKACFAYAAGFGRPGDWR